MKNPCLGCLDYQNGKCISNGGCYKEAIRRVEEFGLHHAISDLPHSVRTVEAFNLAINTLESADKYRWHDLRENPMDLPLYEELVDVMCRVFFTGDKTYRLCPMRMCYKHKILYGKHLGWAYSHPYKFNFETDSVIAWKEIEPFEEKE